MLLVTALITWMALGSASSAQPLPPSSGRLLWLAADRNISTSGSTVVGWNDAGTNIARFSSSVGNPTLGVASFPNGNHAAVLFDGASGIVLNGAGALSQQDLSIYIVATSDISQASRIFLLGLPQQRHRERLGQRYLGRESEPNEMVHRPER